MKVWNIHIKYIYLRYKHQITENMKKRINMLLERKEYEKYQEICRQENRDMTKQLKHWINKSTVVLLAFCLLLLGCSDKNSDDIPYLSDDSSKRFRHVHVVPSDIGTGWSLKGSNLNGFKFTDELEEDKNQVVKIGDEDYERLPNVIKDHFLNVTTFYYSSPNGITYRFEKTSNGVYAMNIHGVNAAPEGGVNNPDL